ncbi:major facilitator superfamily domain-containing protein [Suillus clintonianus]|uniref:major facilitator superfamily domain-containing protein n=1 Tax=Suillus clintonianus TaxID=1904413 RepID=UPI001B871C3F|nr:major facilitator superfamily domain-containing protein [Suillus clintonianus]KAG2151401.1 major facilitator superfamily domain-containing protein [Suillus clintonianus]
MHHPLPSSLLLSMSTPLASDETATQASDGALQSVKSTGNISNTNNSDAPDFPDGGFTAWGTALGAFLIQFSGFGYTSAYGVFQDFYTQTYLTNSTPSAIAWIGSVNAFMILSVGPVAGRMLDRGAFYHLMIIGCLLQCFFLFMLSLAKPNGYYQIFLSQGIGSGAAIGLTNVPTIAVVSHHFQRRRSFVMGFVVAGASMGSIVHPIMLNNLINGRLGFANGVRASAAMTSGLLLIACLLMRTRLPPQPQAVSYTRVLRNSLRDRAYVCACLGMAASEVGFFFVAFYLQLDSRLHGLDESFSFYSLAIFHTGCFIGRLTAGIVSAYLGVPHTVIGSSLIASAIIFAMIGLRSMASVTLIGITYGYFSGIYVGMMAPMITYLTPEISDIGARIGISFAVASIGSLSGTFSICFFQPTLTFSLGAPICGAFLTSNYIWWKAAVFAGSLATGGTIMFIFMQFILKIRQKTASVCSKETGV